MEYYDSGNPLFFTNDTGNDIAVVDLFSYPDGACDERVVAAVQAAGYREAVLAGEGPGGQRYHLPRVFRCPA